VFHVSGDSEHTYDYVLHLDDAPVGSTHTWDVCLVVKPYAGRADVLAEVSRYEEG